MAEAKIELKGWKGIVAAVAVLAIVAVGGGRRTDTDLSQDRVLLMELSHGLRSSEVGEALTDPARLLSSGLASTLAEARDVERRAFEVLAITGRSSTLSWGSGKPWVLRVVYRVTRPDGTPETKTRYYRTKKRAFGDGWETPLGFATEREFIGRWGFP